MDLETIRKKSVADLKEIAAMMGIEVPDKCTKAKLIELITGDSGESEPAPAPAPEPVPEPAPAAAPAAEPAPSAAARPQKTSKRGRPKGTAAKADSKPAEPAKTEEAAQAPEPAKAEKAEEAAEPARSGKRGRPSKNRPADKAKENNAEKAGEKPAENQNDKPADKPAEKPAEEPNGNGGNGRKLEFSENSEEVSGLLDVMPEGYGFLRTNKYYTGNKDVFVAPNFIRKYALRTGDELTGRSRPQRDNDKYQALFYITSINGRPPEQANSRVAFESLTPIYPDEQLKLETTQNELSTRLIDLIAPIGKGQRGMIVSPPKAGKTVLLKKIANAIITNYPEVKLIVLLIDERPEEVTDMRESIQGEVVSSTFDEMPERHIKVAEMVFERARRLVEFGHDVVILM
ncbi:MAG: transcription termination factor Rho, partial [Clostridia bacterium]|nr:transcription termination factor Rho [Clostridia bacterium]